MFFDVWYLILVLPCVIFAMWASANVNSTYKKYAKVISKSGYTANDVVLIILWTVSTISDISYLPMLMCFVTFMANDVYGFYNWKRMQSRQADDIEDI